MLTYTQALIIGITQGITELFPVSSLGHSIIIPPLLGFNIPQNTNSFLIFLIATHLATSLVLFIFFFNDWILIIKAIFRSLKERTIRPTDTYAKIGWLLVVTTIPAGILGILLEQKLQTFFSSPRYVAIFLILNGLLLFGAEQIRKVRSKISQTPSDENIAKLTWSQSIFIGIAQSLALLPGFSRTGATLSGGLVAGLHHEDAARFAFLLATPIIFAAAFLKLPELLTPGTNVPLGPLFIGAITAAVGAYVSVKFLTKYFETKTLIPFAVYCVFIGIISLIIL